MVMCCRGGFYQQLNGTTRYLIKPAPPWDADATGFDISDRTYPQTIACQLSRNPTEDSAVAEIDSVHITIGAFFHIDYIR